MYAFGAISLFVLIWVGGAVLWSLRLAYRSRGAAADDPIRLVLTISGWVLILVGILGTVVQVLLPFGLFGVFMIVLTCGVILAIIIMAVGRFRSAERRGLLWCLAAAAERGIPLEQAVHAFSLERMDELGVRSARLAELLESGMPLSLALSETNMGLPLDVTVGVRVGVETGDLGPALNQVAKYDADSDLLIRSILERCIYLTCVACVVVGLLTFVMWRIVPVFFQMFQEFDIELPPITVAAVAVSEIFINWGILTFPIFAALLFGLVVGLFYYVGWIPRDVPFLHRVALRVDSAYVMRVLAFAVQQRRPLPKMIWFLANQYPKWSIRSRLTRAGVAIHNGEHWCDAMRHARLLLASDVAVLKAAERSGNLQWALEEMADSNMRRLAYRLRLGLNVVFPLVLLVFGVLIMFFVVGLFMPLVALIEGLL